MKHIFKYIFIPFALLVSAHLAQAQPTGYHVDNGVATKKGVSTQNPDGTYTITLETYATGESTLIETAIPVDIVLVLDVSGSMSSAAAGNNGYYYKPLESTQYTYTSYGNNQYYYKHSDENYYLVERDGRRLRFDVDTGWGTDYWYLYGTSAQHTRPSQVANNNTPIWEGILYERSEKIDALHTAVGEFIDVIRQNNESTTFPTGVAGNQIAVVKFASDEYSGITAGNNYTNQGYNYTQVRTAFTVVNQSGATTLKNNVNSLTAAGATSVDYGMHKAVELFADLQRRMPNRESTKVVVMFTDGEPNHQSGFVGTVADDAINYAHELKSTYNAIVYSVGLFGTLSQNVTKQMVDDYMNYVSSNYPDAVSRGNHGNRAADSDFYKDASTGEMDLSSIFKSIAEGSGAATATVGTDAQIRDIVTNSFEVPDNYDEDDVIIEVYKINATASDWTKDTDYDLSGVEPVFSKESDGKDKLVVSGFDFSKEDTTEQQGDGNWVGIRYDSNNQPFYAGRKLVIKFNVSEVDDATGGDGTATNTVNSGVYVKGEDGEYTMANNYLVPHANLPLVIRIKKSGLRHGESATFEIQRTRPVGWNDAGATLEEKMANVTYNALGKPVPDMNWKEDPDDEDEDPGWHDWSKVILTNKGSDGANVEKTLFALDPAYVYRIIEDDWGWSYDLSHTGGDFTTSDYEVNPFEFKNVEKTDVVKHAEAVTINHFKTAGTVDDSRVEAYQSSKVKKF